MKFLHSFCILIGTVLEHGCSRRVGVRLKWSPRLPHFVVRHTSVLNTMPEPVNCEMDILILCGGLGTRLRSIVEDRPKSMAVIRGRPFLEWQLSLLMSFGFKRVILCIGYQGDVIREYFLDGSRFGLDIQYSVETELLGTGGAIRRAVPCIQSDPVLILNGDSWCEVEMQKLGQLA